MTIALATVTMFGVGCANVFVPKHKVMVDAISAPGVAKPSGQSYRLVPKQSVVNNVSMEAPVIKACVDAALAGIGMFEPPPNVPPDVFIEITYGATSGPRGDPRLKETFLQLSARANPERVIAGGKGPEVWDVRVGVFGVSGRPETAMPLLCAVAADYIGTDTKAELKIEVPENAPAIKSVRESAITSLESKGRPAAEPASRPAGRAPTAPTAPPAPSAPSPAPARVTPATTPPRSSDTPTEAPSASIPGRTESVTASRADAGAK